MLLALGCAELGEPRFVPAVGTVEISSTIPAEGEPLDPLGRIDVCLSAEADPRVVDEVAMTLHSGELTFDSQIEVQLFAWRQPGSRTGLADERWCPGSVLSLTPASALQPGLIYRVVLRPAVVGWAGESLDTTQSGWELDEQGEPRWTIELSVAGDPGDLPPTDVPTLEPGPTLSELFEPGEIFDPERAACGCHQREGELAFERLDLSSPERAYAGLVLRGRVEPTGFPMITPRRPGDSYLLQKLLRTSEGEPLHAIHGEPMPPEGSLPHADLAKLAHWIADGARP